MKKINKKVFLTLLISLCLLFAASCKKNKTETPPSGYPDEGSTQTETNENEPQKDTHLSGKVISVTHNTEGIAEFTILTEAESVCRITPGEISLNAVNIGQEVLVTADGSVMEADPMQAVAKNVDVTSEFNNMPLPVEVYSVYGITASKISEALPTSGFRFYRFSDYSECLDFLRENELSDEFDKAVGSTDISELTSSFFENKDLGVFIVNNAENKGNRPMGVFHSDRTLYLSIERTSQNTVLTNTEFDAFLMPLEKSTEVLQGIVLTENKLEAHQGETEGKDENNDPLQTRSE